MSYCRFSSDDWTCDVYCYEDVSGGFTTHVASRTPIDVPKNNVSFTDNVAWFEMHDKQMKFLATVKYRNLNLKYDGESFNDNSLEGFRDTLLMLKDEGYNVPKYVFERIDEEISEDKCKD